MRLRRGMREEEKSQMPAPDSLENHRPNLPDGLLALPYHAAEGGGCAKGREGYPVGTTFLSSHMYKSSLTPVSLLLEADLKGEFQRKSLKSQCPALELLGTGNPSNYSLTRSGSHV